MKPFLSHDNDPPPPPPQPPPPPPPQPPSTPPSTTDNLATPVTASKPAKRPTRQWAAWTREEEECFFTALRQVGKNFEKITCRVQSKNKDQVRHYYYRLVRRMNKLLAPGLSLDAKNSKDTNAAMLRWWSLLEKYSYKASKLHLKPRRFKIFVEALEHQLMKDRKKNGKKRTSLGETFLPPPPTTASNFNKLSGSDARALKVSVTDNQNGQKSGQGRGSSRRNTSMGVIRSSNKGESSHSKQARQQRKTGTISAAAIRRWEKAAMAGVSLVADAAEHLERTAGELYSANQEQSDPGPSVQVQMNTSNLSKLVRVIEDNAQTTTKLKLQLFPVDESTRKTLEMDKHNPHLELTLSTRKKISSVVEHLDRKWGSSRVACGELIIFPFNIQRENLLGYQRWTRDSGVTAGEVYAMIGSPTVFRLRYGWIPSAELQSGSSGTISSSFNVLENGSKQSLPPAEEMDKLDNLVDHVLGNHQTSNGQNSSFKEPTAPTFGEANKNTDVDLDRDALGHHLGLNVLSIATEDCVASPKNLRNMVDQKLRKIPSLSTREWTDTLTNVGAGELVTQVSDSMDANCDTPAFRSSQCLENIPFSCDSFDAAIAAHISGHNKIGFSGPSAHSTSIWDAEETCDAFLFQNRAVPNNWATAPGVGLSIRSSARTDIMAQNSAEDGMAADNLPEDPMNECPSETHETSSAKNLSSLTDMYWPDSLGPLELDVPSCKYYSEDLILSDSMSGLNRLLASSLDAFQNYTFFGFDEKGPPPSASGGQGGASFVGKIGISDNAAAQSLQA